MNSQPPMQQPHPQLAGHPSTMPSPPTKDGRVICPDEAILTRAQEIITKEVTEFTAQSEAPIMFVYNMANSVGRGDSLTMSGQWQPRAVQEQERPLYQQGLSQLKVDVLDLENNFPLWFGMFKDWEMIRKLIAIVSSLSHVFFVIALVLNLVTRF